MHPFDEEAALANFRTKTDVDRHFLRLAMADRVASDDPKARTVVQSGVAAVLVKNGRIIARSANVLPPRLKIGRLKAGSEISEEDRYHLIEHAERAAIFQALLARRDMDRATIYCTRFPCSDCARAIVWAGLSRGVFAAGYAGEIRWIQSQRAAVRILRQAGVTVRVLEDRAVKGGRIINWRLGGFCDDL